MDPLLAAIIAGNAVVMAWTLFWVKSLANVILDGSRAIENRVSLLDSQLAEAVGKLGAGELFPNQSNEAASPFALVAADWLKQRLSPVNTFEVLEPSRGAGGKFTTDNL